MSEDPNIDFEYGFTFFKKSRGLNRQANYLLTKSLLDRLEKYPSLNFHSHVKRVVGDRKAIIEESKINSIPEFVDPAEHWHAYFLLRKHRTLPYPQP